MQREKKKYLTPMIHSIEVGQILPIAASPGVTVPGAGNASEREDGGGTPPPMQSPRNYWGSGFQTYDDDDDETAYEYGW